ncbi:1,4-dihydroxy-2-naphthoate octaprenyltransferase [Candidatus Parabeggiatoa sp. HSG14]|uniref:1,4-dihydroxy-2-naphthoate octaprenyltransferase n=1 Tax=Candidatus Parabeggiatoa sp. HSG14 TaxID=3055593 RepID=UPI0025A71CE9|nr:1,4-dihydroxy-2-naphthoate octaprenyltransferase [Thiotrichales bacterium HSG14]
MAHKTLATWIMATRPQFFTVTILPILLGTVIAWHLQGIFLPLYFGLSLLAGLFIHAGINVLNDYFDHLNKTDELNKTPLTPFAGGSRMIQKGMLTPIETYRYGMLLLAAAIGIGLFLVWVRGLPLLWIGLIGVLSGYFYSAPPFSFHSRGLGEVLVGLNFGILVVLGAYYVQTQTLSLVAIIAALPLAILVTAILYLNEFPDYAADKEAGKNTLVVRLGQMAARPIYALLILFSFIVIVLGVIFNNLPLLTLASLLVLPLGFFAIKTLYISYNKPIALIPAIKSTIMLHTLVSVLLILAFVF